jgi:pimeloyl-ACP methyl ester carboxylesterase
MSASGVEEFELSLDGNTISGRLARPRERNGTDELIVAIHGGTYYSKYFDVEHHSLLERGLARGVPIVAIDRPSYGKSTALPDAPDLLHQNGLHLNEIIPRVVSELFPGETEVFVIGHSMGGVVAITIASLRPEWLSGIAVSGIGTVVPPDLPGVFAQLPMTEPLVLLPSDMKDSVMFGPEGSMAPEMPEASHAADTTVPLAELFDVISGWVQRFPELAEAVEVPVHYRQAEFDHLWLTDATTVDAFSQAFRRSGRVDSQITPGAGHCIDFHKASHEFQIEQLEFARSCARD